MSLWPGLELKTSSYLGFPLLTKQQCHGLFSLKTGISFSVSVSVRAQSHREEDPTKNRLLAIKIQFVQMPGDLPLWEADSHLPRSRGLGSLSPSYTEAVATTHLMGQSKLTTFKGICSGLCGLP